MLRMHLIVRRFANLLLWRLRCAVRAPNGFDAHRHALRVVNKE